MVASPIQIHNEEGDYTVRWDGENDPKDPHSKSWAPYWRKWTIVISVASSAFCVACASAVYTVASKQIMLEFRCSQELATLGLTVFVLGLGCGPMLLSPLSELYGRRNIYLVSYALFTIWLVPCALARNIETMLVARFFSGLTGSAFLSVAGGTIADMFHREDLGAPIMLFTLAPFSGPATGPVWGGAVVSFVDWRWIFYVMIIWSVIQWCVLYTLVPETYAPVLLRKKATMLRQATGDARYTSDHDTPSASLSRAIFRSCARPFKLLFGEMICLSLCTLSALLLGVLYLFFGAFPIIFGMNYKFNTWNSGLAFLGIFVGMCIGASCDGLWKRLYMKLSNSNGGVGEPEFRLPSTMIGSLVATVALFGFAWTIQPSIHWIVPIIFSSMFGLGILLCYSGIFTFLVECYPMYAASAMAANAFTRAIFAAAFPLFGTQMYRGLGSQWASSLLAFLVLAMCPSPWIIFYCGKRIRSRSGLSIAAHL